MFGEIAAPVVGAQYFVPGNIETQQPVMRLNDAGKIAQECWLAIPGHYQHTILHEFVIMPNHIHGIIELTQNIGHDTRVQNIEPLQPQNKFQKIIPGSLGSIIRGYKIGVTKWFRQNDDYSKIWQRNYHEHIIRDEKSYLKIADYILNNPIK